MVSKHEFRDVLLSIDWALASFFLIEHTQFELVSSNFIKNLSGIALFALLVIAFELFGKEVVWRLVGKHHRLGKQIVSLAALLLVLAGFFTMVA